MIVRRGVGQTATGTDPISQISTCIAAGGPSDACQQAVLGSTPPVGSGVVSAAPGYPVGSIQDQYATCVQAGGAPSDCVTALTTSSTGMSTNTMLAIAAGLVLVILFAGMSR